jgi:hypothetical protein
MDYFAMLIDGFPILKYEICMLDITEYLLQLKLEDAKMLSVSKVMCNLFRKEYVLDKFKYSRNHGRFPKTDTVFNNFVKYEVIIIYNKLINI